MNKITYITYQSFPAETANSLQTISNIKYFVRNNISVSLYFPLRETGSLGSLEVIQKQYGIDENFEVRGVKHFLPFGRVGKFKKTVFHVSHFIWSGWVVNKYFSQPKKGEVFFTRSEWILYFLSKKDCTVIFECHQTSKVRNFLVRKLMKNDNILFVFLNDSLRKFYKTPDNRSIVLHNGVDPESFLNTDSKKDNSLIFVGSLSRFGEKRNIDFLIDCYEQSDELKKYKLKIIGGPEKDASELMQTVNKKGLASSIFVYGRLTRRETIEKICGSKIGILINSSKNLHSYLHTSPLKYFEYLYGRLNVVAIDYPSHRELPMNDRIIYFSENNVKEFIDAVVRSIKLFPPQEIPYKSIDLDTRAKKIIGLARKARLEGLEPPTL